MKILFSPSETKLPDGINSSISKDSFFLQDFYTQRELVLTSYQEYIQNSDDMTLQKLFGIKKENDLLQNRSIDLFNDPTMKAVQRYTGVAYEYLNYNSLTIDDQIFINNNMIIFSNLFGPILAKDEIPYYKLKQGQKLNDFVVEKFYFENFKIALDNYLQNEFIIDLRAGFYLKFYKLQQPYITMKFIKGGKVVSHWAKAYRGIIVKELAKHQPMNEKTFTEINFENLNIIEIQKSGYKTEYIYEITA